MKVILTTNIKKLGKIGDLVEVYIENQEDKRGQLVLSHKKARASKSWERVNAALENKEIIKGYIPSSALGWVLRPLGLASSSKAANRLLIP